MKKKLSITLEEETIKMLDENTRNGRFRNKSHLIEYSIQKYLNGEQNE